MAQTEGPDLSELAADAARDFFTQIFGATDEGVRRFFRNLYNSFADVGKGRWVKVIGAVVFYLIIRPWIEKLFKWLHDRDRAKQKAKKEAEKAALGGKKAKMSANALRGGQQSGKVLGEVDHTDEEAEAEEELNLAQASGVPEWNKMARKRQKKHRRNLEKQTSEQADEISEEQVMELLDWSDSEDEKKKA